MTTPEPGEPSAGPTPPAPIRAGAHRPRRPLWHGIATVVVVVLAAGAVGVEAYQLRGSAIGSSSSDTNAPLPDDDPVVTPTSGVTGTATSTATATATSTSSATSSAPHTATSTATSTAPAGTVDRTVKVAVYNATLRTGLAASAATKLAGAGWKASSAGNERRFTPPGTTVYYGKASLLATAQAVAKDLGGYRVHLSTTYGSSAVSAVLGSDYKS